MPLFMIIFYENRIVYWICTKNAVWYLKNRIQRQYRYGESFKSGPIIILATYQKLDKEVDVVIDHSQDPNKLIMINTKDFDKIEIIYDNMQRRNLFQKILIGLRKITT